MIELDASGTEQGHLYYAITFDHVYLMLTYEYY